MQNYAEETRILDAKRKLCFDLMEEVRNQCLGLDADHWAFWTGKIFGEKLRELDLEKKALDGTQTIP